MAANQRFRKKPVVIQAIQWDGTDECLVHIYEFTGPADASRIGVMGDQLMIRTLEGSMMANPGDWLVRGVVGEYYPVKPEIFAATYDPEPEPEGTPAK